LKITKVRFPTPLSSVIDIEDDNIDMFVELDNKYTFTLVVTTPRNLITLMEEEKIEYTPASSPMVIVKRITEENIMNALETYLENEAYWLKLYFLAGEIRIELLNDMLEEIWKENNELFEEDENIEN
jgi:hypothetical protein